MTRKPAVAEGDELPQGEPEIVEIDGFWWPKKIGGSRERYLKHEHDSDPAIRLCDGQHRRTAVQAGGHVGIWPRRLAVKYQRVITFEPEPINWSCLQRNVAGNPKITAYNAGLGEKAQDAQLAFNGRNTGGSKVRTPEQVRDRDFLIPIKLMAIDDLGLTDVDFICLDVEGCELRALMGAEKTVEASKPVILVEEWGHLRGQGQTPEQLWRWFSSHGYREVAKVAHDHIFKYRG